MTPNIRQMLEPRTIGRALLVVVLLALIAPFVVYAVPATVGGEASYVVLTASMTPAIAPGDVVVVDAVPARDVRVGDVIVFEQQAGDSIPITHRVIAVDRPADAPPEFRTKGDANEDADLSPVTPDRLVGRVMLTIPLIGHVIQFVGTPAGFVALVVLPLGLLVVSEVVDLLRSGRSGNVVASDGDDGGAVSTADATVDDAAQPTATPADDQVVITPADLTLTSVALGAFAVYAGYAALQNTTTVSVTLAVAVGALFALAAGIRLFGLADEGIDAGTVSAAAPSVYIHDARPPGPTVDVASPADLRAIAGALGRPVLRDDGDRYVVLDGSVTYACDVPAERDCEDAVEEHPDTEPMVDTDSSVVPAAASASESATPSSASPNSGGAGR
ncbi:signal peptidase I [Haloplanus aerogenes]|uniref:Signal peptidase I n=1 Tax=Haloplanus aerogenes TaxID=660522 RepID=A0A3G8QSI3_9EURY|nr:signal peptidase I [Haloplanus aerogenes]AZH25396.1 signal peptidase I [Haloplanus aerogenes]RMB25102.1 signal peptidase I [Haloplanus aerogenes]